LLHSLLTRLEGLGEAPPANLRIAIIFTALATKTADCAITGEAGGQVTKVQYGA
jgi:hypothetical protein